MSISASAGRWVLVLSEVDDSSAGQCHGSAGARQSLTKYRLLVFQNGGKY